MEMPDHFLTQGDADMTTTTDRPTDTALADQDLALAKAAAGIDLTLGHKRLVALELARRAHLADTDAPTNGQDWAILRRIANGSDVRDSFANLVAAYDDWAACQEDVESWRHRSDVVDTEPMSADRAFDYVSEHLTDAVTALVGAA